MEVRHLSPWLKNVAKRLRLLSLYPYFFLGRWRRRAFTKPLYVAITGSWGKTTTKELIAAVLNTKGPTSKNQGTHNTRREVVRALFRTRRSHFACVMELGIHEPGNLDLPLWIFQPQVGVLTHIKRDHYTAFRTPEAVAVEKGKLAAAVPDEGTVILNADDPLVMAMAARTGARVVTYGLAPAAQVRAEDLRSAWPEPLTGTLVVDGRRLPFRTRLHGTHWIHAILAAVATGKVAGVAPEQALAAIAAVPPVPGRYSPLEVGGITFLRDDWKAPYDSLPALLQFLEQARAERKILLMGTISDYPGSASPKYRALAREATRFCDKVIFVRTGALYNLTKGGPDDRIMVFDTLEALNAFLRSYLREGDFVVVKGSAVDRLERVPLGWATGIRCWLPRCHKIVSCATCRQWRRA